MRNLLLCVAAVLLFGLLLGVFRSNRTAIRLAQNEAAHLESTRDSLVAVIWHRRREEAVLRATRDTLESQAGRLRDSVDVLERDRVTGQLTTRQIRTLGALQKRLRVAFPQLGKNGWGVTTLPAEPGDTIGIQHFVVPAWFAQTFVIDQANAKSWLSQKNKLLAVDSLRLAITVLQDSITRLTTLNGDAYRAGYQSAYGSYQDLSSRYVAELKKPRIELGGTIGMIAAAGAGALIVGLTHD